MIRLERLKSIIKSEIIVAAASWLLSFILVAVCWIARTEGAYLNNYISYMMMLFLTLFLVLTAACVIAWLFRNTKKKKLLRLRAESGYTDEYFSALEKSTKLNGKFSVAFKNAIYLSGEYTDAKRYEQALEMVDRIDESSCNASQRVRLASELLKIYSLMKDEQKASSIYIALGEALLVGKISDEALGASDLSTSLYKYLIGDYEAALNSARLAFDLAGSDKQKADCALMLGLISLKLDDKESAKRYTAVASKYISTPSQKEDLLSLMTLVERAYGI